MENRVNPRIEPGSSGARSRNANRLGVTHARSKLVFVRRPRLLDMPTSDVSETSPILIEEFCCFHSNSRRISGRRLEMGHCRCYFVFASLLYVIVLTGRYRTLQLIERRQVIYKQLKIQIKKNLSQKNKFQHSSSCAVLSVFLIRRAVLCCINSNYVLAHNNVTVRYCVEGKDSGSVKVRLRDVT